MKRINSILAAVTVIAVIFFSACTEETGLAPEIKFLNSVTQTTLAEGVDSFTVAGTITSEEGLTEVKFFKVTTAGETQIGDAITTFDDKLSYSFQNTITDITEDITVKVTATDKANLTTSANFMIKLTAAGGDIATWTQKLGSQSHASIGSSFASSNGMVYLLADAKTNAAMIDFIYFEGATNKSTLASPDDTDVATIFTGISTWSTINSTKFATTMLTTTEFDAIADDVMIIQKATGASLTKANMLSNGDIVAFVTDGGKMGLVKIKNIDATSNSMDIEVKVQK